MKTEEEKAEALKIAEADTRRMMLDAAPRLSRVNGQIIDDAITSVVDLFHHRNPAVWCGTRVEAIHNLLKMEKLVAEIDSYKVGGKNGPL